MWGPPPPPCRNNYNQTGGWFKTTSKEYYVDLQYDQIVHHRKYSECVQLPGPVAGSNGVPGAWSLGTVRVCARAPDRWGGGVCSRRLPERGKNGDVGAWRADVGVHACGVGARCNGCDSAGARQ